jgi:uncharacterized membrane protein YcaP (DUF421 family)
MSVIYLLLLVLLRFSGKRTLAQMDTFDFVLLLIISETTQQAIVGDDSSMTNAVLAISTIVFLAMTLTGMKQKWHGFENYAEDVPMVIVRNGVPDRERLDRSRVSEDDILQTARESQGLERLDQIKWAILERDGVISIIPK